MGSTWGAEYRGSGETPSPHRASGQPGVRCCAKVLPDRLPCFAAPGHAGPCERSPICQDCGAPLEEPGWCDECLNGALAFEAAEPLEYDPDADA